MHKQFLAGLLALAAMPAAAAQPVTTIHIAGDSTAQTNQAPRYPQTGWGQMLRCGLSAQVAVRNHAIGGRSTRTFIGEGRLDKIKAEIKRGDVLLIQFGHNDANTVKIERYADPAGAYRTNLSKMLAVAKSAGAQPVLITPVSRRNFENGQVKADFAAWSHQVRMLARELGVPLIDLEKESATWLERTGEEASKRYFLHFTPEDKVGAYPEGIKDDTHFSELGARGVAEIVARELKALNLPVSRHILRSRPALTRADPLGSTDCG